MTIEEAIKNLDDNLYAGDVNNLSTEALEKALDVLEKVRDRKMLELPCKLYDTVYTVNNMGTIDVGYVAEISMREHGLTVTVVIGNGSCITMPYDEFKQFYNTSLEEARRIRNDD